MHALSRVRSQSGENGQTTVEYAFVVALIAIVLAASLAALNAPFGHFVQSKIVDAITTLL